MSIFDALVELKDKIKSSDVGSWSEDQSLLLNDGAELAFEELDIEVTELKYLMDRVWSMCSVNNLLCRITWSYWLSEIVGNLDLVKKYKVIPKEENKWLLPEVEVRILLEGTVFVIKASPTYEGSPIYSWGGGHDWEMSLSEIKKKLADEIINIVPVV